MTRSVEFDGLYRAFRTTMAEEGAAGLYRGIGAVLLGGIPATSVYLTGYEVIYVGAASSRLIHLCVIEITVFKKYPWSVYVISELPIPGLLLQWNVCRGSEVRQRPEMCSFCC